MSVQSDIPVRELSTCKLSLIDDVGQLFFWQQRVFRAIRPESVQFVRELFERGVIASLVSKGLFVKSWISDHTIDGYQLVVEHEMIPTVTYPYEWSFSMLQAAALLVLDLNSELRPYGLQTKDCHGFNVLFAREGPRYVDLGSIVRVPSGSRCWRAEEEFVRYYAYALRMWSAGDADLGRPILESESRLMSHGAYLRYRHPLLRRIPSGTLHLWMRYYYKFRTLSLPETRQIARTKLPNAVARLTTALGRKRLLPLQAFPFARWRRRLQGLSRAKSRSMWGDYQSELLDAAGNVQATPRLKRVVTILKELGVQSVVEIGGNQGALSRLAARDLGLARIICTDYDENAIDVLYRLIRNTNSSVTPVVLDCMFPVVTPRTVEPSTRLRCAAAVGLAITHHLVLTQRVPLDHVLRMFGEFSTRYVLIEFMPLGLWDGRHGTPTPPWYTLTWFSETFQQRYKLLHQEELEQNRILFVGEKHNCELAPESYPG